MGHPKGVSSAQLRTLDRLTALPALRGFYLAGGTWFEVEAPRLL